MQYPYGGSRFATSRRAALCGGGTAWTGADVARSEQLPETGDQRASPGPLSPAEDAVYYYVTAIARGYLGHSVWSPVA